MSCEVPGAGNDVPADPSCAVVDLCGSDDDMMAMVSGAELQAGDCAQDAEAQPQALTPHQELLQRAGLATKNKYAYEYPPELLQQRRTELQKLKRGRAEGNDDPLGIGKCASCQQRVVFACSFCLC